MTACRDRVLSRRSLYATPDIDEWCVGGPLYDDVEVVPQKSISHLSGAKQKNSHLVGGCWKWFGYAVPEYECS
jgi:hypothetical protein